MGQRKKKGSEPFVTGLCLDSTNPGGTPPCDFSWGSDLVGPTTSVKAAQSGTDTFHCTQALAGYMAQQLALKVAHTTSRILHLSRRKQGIIS